MKKLAFIATSIFLISCASEQVSPPATSSKTDEGGGLDTSPCGNSGSDSKSSTDSSPSSGGLETETSLKLLEGLFDEDSGSSSEDSGESSTNDSSDSDSSSTTNSDPCSTSGLGDESYNPTKNKDGVDLDKVWADVIKPENWKKCHDAGYVYDWAWSERDENKDETPSNVSFEKTCFNGEHGSVVIKFVDGCYDDLGTASTVIKESALTAGVTLFHEKWLDESGNQYSLEAVKKSVTDKTSSTEWQGYRPDQCGYVESDNTPRMVWTKFTVTEEKATVSYKTLKP